MSTDLSTPSTKDRANKRSDLRVAFTEAGTVLEPEEGLRRFLIQTRENIEVDKSHFTEELFSDIFALIETGHLGVEAAHGSAETLQEEPLMSGIAIASTTAAVYLLWSINSQRGAREDEYRKALKMFVEFEHDIHDEKFGDSKEERRDNAIENLREKMQHSGLQFVNLPDEQRRFNKSQFRDIAKDKGIGEPLRAGAIKRCRSFLKKPFMEKVDATAVALSRVSHHTKNLGDYAKVYTSNTLQKCEDSMLFVGHVAGEYAANPFRVHKIGKSTLMGFRELKELNAEIREQKIAEKTNTLPSRNTDPEHKLPPLTLDQLNSVSLSSIEKIGHDWHQDDKDDLIKIMRDQERHEQSAIRAKRSLVIQSAFEGLQLAMIPVKLMSEQHRETVWMNVYSFFAAMGPLVGFAEGLKEERAKANSKLADKAERLGTILGIDAHTKTSEELEVSEPEHDDNYDNDNDNDNDDDHLEQRAGYDHH